MANMFGHTFPPDSWGRKTTIPQIPPKRVLSVLLQTKIRVYINTRKAGFKEDRFNKLFHGLKLHFQNMTWKKFTSYCTYSMIFFSLRDATIPMISPKVPNPCSHQTSWAAQGDTPTHSWHCRAPSWTQTTPVQVIFPFLGKSNTPALVLA